MKEYPKIEIKQEWYEDILKMYQNLSREQQLEFLPKLWDKLVADGYNLKEIDFVLGSFNIYLKSE